jgi:D-sedoheptulose 7-phosphate isomerase
MEEFEKENNGFFKYYFEYVSKIALCIDTQVLNEIILELVKLRNNQGRLIFLGVGGSAGNCSHAVNDFRKLCGIDAITPVDNVSELTARTNDEGWETVFSEWMKVTNCNQNDALFIFSVGGGDLEKNVSVNLINAVDVAKEKKMKIFGVVGREGGYVKKNSNLVITVPSKDSNLITPISESFQSLIWHSIVSHPNFQINKTKW